jgi:hypothetical protein
MKISFRVNTEKKTEDRWRTLAKIKLVTHGQIDGVAF